MKITCKKEIQRLIAKGIIKGVNKKSAESSIASQRSIDKSQESEELLFQLLMPIYGDYYKEGEVLKELTPFSSRRFRLDIALPRFAIGIECDGIKGHAMHKGGLNLDGIVRDRTKDMLLTANGWHVFRCMRKHITQEPQIILDALAFLIKTRKRNDEISCTKNSRGISHFSK